MTSKQRAMYNKNRRDAQIRLEQAAQRDRCMESAEVKE